MAAADAVESNRSLLNPQDAQVVMGRAAAAGVNFDTPLGEFLTDVLGMDLSAPWFDQMQSFANAQTTNQNPLDKARNIAEGTNMRPGAGAGAERLLSRAAAGGQQQSPIPPEAGLDSVLGL